MSSLAIVDIDGIVANSDKRFELARTSFGKIDWITAFDPANVPLDTLVPGADVAIAQLEQLNYEIVYLSSRPEHMYQATWTWLNELNLAGPQIILKPDIAKYVKTLAWKAERVQELAAKHESVIFIDDEEANTTAVQNMVASGQVTNVQCFASLAEALVLKESRQV